MPHGHGIGRSSNDQRSDAHQHNSNNETRSNQSNHDRQVAENNRK